MIQIDMPMPDNCDECRFNTEYAFCKAMPDNFCGNTDDRKRPEWCPLKEQEAVVPVEEFIKGTNCHKYHCKRCGNIVGTIFDDKHSIFPGAKVSIKHFCDVCGQAVKWE